MLNFLKANKSNDVFALWAGRADGRALRASLTQGRLHLLSLAGTPANMQEMKKWAGSARGVFLLPPEHYAFGVLPAPVGASGQQLSDALKWAFAKDAEMDMASAEWEIMLSKGSDSGGGLLKESYWVFAIEKGKLDGFLAPALRQGIHVEVVDTLATAQRNLCWAEIRETKRAGAYASFVIGQAYSALGIVSHDGDLLFHKQLEWSESTVGNPDQQERLILDLQRSLGYFERRQSSFGVAHGYVFGRNSQGLADSLRTGLGGFDWSSPAYPGVDFSALAMSEVDGDLAWLVGSLSRWV